ncbi:MAG: hypothetical protein KAI47_10080, partial [Deltaproteobacteria bacterium]|nr:hypothetical protein [Deltaproteobacteria bacterium]
MMDLEDIPYDGHRPTPKLFYGQGRRDLLGAMREELIAGESVVILGGRVMGKTTFLRVLQKAIEAASPPGSGRSPSHAVYVSLGSGRFNGPGDVFRAIQDAIVDAYPD